MNNNENRIMCRNRFQVGQRYQERGGMWNVTWIVTDRRERVTSTGTRIVTVEFRCPENGSAFRKRTGRDFHRARVRLTGQREACVGLFYGTITA